ncbi:hypothetical protein QN277_026315 [Acacia crassicarpa]|uniref:Dynein light chain n=1 Tax=Acacia crassicarpa TaxID=499986 RepID=A0AAE1K6F8_9FABA|nr:hypothetical protein QN277_026315 [Acacia crassicarpa]
MANQQKRGFLYIYKGGKGNTRKDNELDHHESSSPVIEVGKKSNPLSWLTRISKARSTNVSINGGQRGLEAAAAGSGFVEARKSTSCLEVGSGGEYEEGRKSVSAESESGGGGVIVEGRKSVSHIETNLSAVRGVVEGRKSVSQIETLSSVTANLQVKVLVTDMPSFMQVQAFRCARRTYDSLEKFSSKHIAHNIKKEFDKTYGPVWHCIVGSSFGSFVTHSTGCFLYFSMEKLHILLFKTKVKKVSG